MSSLRPSVGRRALVAAAVLLCFYATTIGVALVLLPLPILAFLGAKKINIALVALAAGCWIPAFSLLAGILRTRPPPFVAPGRLLSPAETPELFAMIGDLAMRAGTAPPAEVYLSAGADMYVMETGGGLFGFGSRRVLCVGAPMLATHSVQEVRAMLAHELGHFAGGDTRLSGLLAFTEGAFRSVLESTTRDELRDEGSHWLWDMGTRFAEWVGGLIVRFHARIYLWLTRPGKQRQELAADALAAALAGRDATLRMLESSAFVATLYHFYLTTQVAPAVNEWQVAPTDVLAGFERYRVRAMQGGLAAEVAKALHEEKTDPFDTHPALRERLASVSAMPQGPVVVDGRNACVLLGGFPLDAWLVDSTPEAIEQPIRRQLMRMDWLTASRMVEAPRALASAKDMAARLYPPLRAPTLATMLAAVVSELEAGRLHCVVETVLPDIVYLTPFQRQQAYPGVAKEVLSTLLVGALSENGAEVVDSVGAPCPLFVFRGEHVDAAELAAGAMRDAAGKVAFGRIVAKLTPAATPSFGPRVDTAPVLGA